ncbi:MAG: ABC transporter permease subunit [Bauldia sp.]|nr:ABC transporter permease subunit [Bauldia sp.]
MSGSPTDARDAGRAPKAPARRSLPQSGWSLLLLAPALLLLAALFVYPLALSLVSAFTDEAGSLSFASFGKVLELYGGDVVFTGVVALVVVAITDILAVAIGGYLILGRSRSAVAILRWLYRWPLFIPFVVAAQMMRSFLAKNGLMNNSRVAAGILDPASTVGFLDWRGVIITFVWKQLPFVTLIVAGAMASLDRSMIEAARNLGAGRFRVLVEIIAPQVRGPLVVASVLTFVTLLSVLSVPMMINAGSPTMITVDMAYRITSLSDYGAANALGVISYLMTAAVAWIYLRQGVGRRLEGP